MLYKRTIIDFPNTFSHGVKPTIIQIILNLAVTNDWSLRQFDVNNAFLQGTLIDDVHNNHRGLQGTSTMSLVQWALQFFSLKGSPIQSQHFSLSLSLG